MSRSGPDWLAELQARFGEAIRTPLDRGEGVLRARTSAYDEQMIALLRDKEASHLAVYNRQYWLRLFEALQGAFPLTTRLLGAWTFNGHAERFLVAHPPRGWDLDRAADGFEAFLEQGLHPEHEPERRALLEAARIDAAWREVFRAPEIPAFRPDATQADRLLDARLVRSPAVAWIEEHWPLLELRRTSMGTSAEWPLSLPPRLSGGRWWALVRRDEGMAQLALEPREAELLSLLEHHPVREALGRLEASCSPETRAELPARTHAWLARGMQLGFWCALA